MVISESPDFDFVKQELSIDDEVLYFNFITGEEYIPKAEISCLPEDNINLLEKELSQISENIGKQVTDHYEFTYEIILIFKRNNYKLLSNTIFCYNIIDIDKEKNYTISRIFDNAKFTRLTLDEIGADKQAFVKEFSSTSLFSKFVEDTFDFFYKVYVRGELIDPNTSHTSRFVKNIVNAFEIMPSSETKRKTFFEHNPFKVFSLLSVYQAESHRFDAFISNLKHKKFMIEDSVKFYMDRTKNKHSSFFYSDRKVKANDKLLDTTLLTTTVKSNRSLNNNTFHIGKYYFKSIKTEKLVNITLKDLNESQIELKQMLDIFS